jgi:hypothetical protein
VSTSVGEKGDLLILQIIDLADANSSLLNFLLG